MQRVASFDLSPPLAAPLRFFLTAPAFAMAAGLLLAATGTDGLASRWSPTTLALTHLMTLGFLGMAMLGALIQILPVVAGVAVAGTARTARGVHLLLTAGTIALVAGFLRGESRLFLAAMLMLGAAFTWFVVAAAIGARRGGVAGPTPRGIRLALAALVVTVALGLALAAAFGGLAVLPASLAGRDLADLSLPTLAHVHALWGLGGWVGLLVIAVAYQVVPMFQVTADYPGAMRRWLPAALLASIALWTAAIVCGPALSGAIRAPDAATEGTASDLSTLVTWLSAGAAAIGYALFAAVTLRLLWRRKRPKLEATTLFWYLGASALLGCALVWMLGAFRPLLRESAAWPLALGILAIVGFAASVVNGMLYRIVPFLVWYHLQTAVAGTRIRVPNARDLIGQRAMLGQFVLQVVAIFLLVAATLRPEHFARAAGIILLLSQGWLWINLMQAGGAARNGMRRLRQELHQEMQAHA